MRSSKRARVFGLQTTPVSLCGRLKYLFFDNPISVIGRTGIASCSPNKTFKSGRRVYAVRTHVVSAFQRTIVVPCSIAVTPTTKLAISCGTANTPPRGAWKDERVYRNAHQPFRLQKPVLWWRDWTALQPDAVLRAGDWTVCEILLKFND